MVRAGAGSDDGGGLLRLLRASGGLLSPGALQGDERPPLVALGPYHPVREATPQTTYSLTHSGGSSAAKLG